MPKEYGPAGNRQGRWILLGRMKDEKRGPCRACFAKDQEPQGYARKIALNIADLTGVVKRFWQPILHLFKDADKIRLSPPPRCLPWPLLSWRRIHCFRVNHSSARSPSRLRCSFLILQIIV